MKFTVVVSNLKLKRKKSTPKAESKRSKHEQKKLERKKDRKNMGTLMIGLDAAGKTSILTMCKHIQWNPSIPDTLATA